MLQCRVSGNARSSSLETDRSQGNEMPIYQPSIDSGRLRQGELVSGITQVLPEPGTIGPGRQVQVALVVHPIAVILTQDCDLEADYRARQAGRERTGSPSVLFCEAMEADKLRTSQGITSRKWSEVRSNTNERYQYLRQVEPPEDAKADGLPPLAIDFKRFFTVPTGEVYHRLSSEQTFTRRCRLMAPYREHLASRFYHFQQRVGLPEQH